MSGGQQQRIAVARAVAFPPRVLLMDEPLGALDLKLREAMQIEIRRIQRELSITTVYVTHDQTEAMNMSDRIAVMNDGVIEQLGSAEEIYGRPASRFVAGFVGQINLLAGRVVGEDGEWVVVEAAGVRARVSKQDSVRAGSEVSLGIRPELFKAVATDAVPSGMNALDGRIAGRTFAGNLLHVYVDIDDGTRVILEARPQDPLGGDGSAIRLRKGETTGRSALLWEYWCDRCRVRCRCERGNLCGRADAIRVRQQREHGKKDASRGGRGGEAQ